MLSASGVFSWNHAFSSFEPCWVFLSSAKAEPLFSVDHVPVPGREPRGSQVVAAGLV